MADSIGTDQNRIRSLRGLLTVDAWHSKPTDKNRFADLSVFVNFRSARLGDATDDINFELRLRQAELSVFIHGDSEIDPATIWRGDDTPTSSVTSTNTSKREGGWRAALFGELSVKEQNVGIKGEVEEAGTRESEDNFQTKTEERLVRVDFERGSDNRPVWVFEPVGIPTKSDPRGEFLAGRPWQENGKTLLKFADTREKFWEGDPPSVQIWLKCRREHLHFYNFHVRDQDGQWRPSTDPAKELVAAEYLRSKLLGEHLHAEDMRNPVSMVILGDVWSEPRGEGEFTSG